MKQAQACRCAAKSVPKGRMLGFLFRGLTAGPARGVRLFDAVTAQARRPHWYVEGKVPDTLDGRFAVLSTVAALVIVRLEGEGEQGDLASAGLTERFIAVMESEHRELGLGDPTLGKTVRKLVGMLAQRTAVWREACGGTRPWAEAARESLYKDNASPDALRHSAEALRRFWNELGKRRLADLEQGKIG